MLCWAVPVLVQLALSLQPLTYSLIRLLLGQNFMAQTGDPTGTGTGGESVYKFLYGEQAKFFDDEINPRLRHKKIGTVSMVNKGPNTNASQVWCGVCVCVRCLHLPSLTAGSLASGAITSSSITGSSSAMVVERLWVGVSVLLS